MGKKTAGILFWYALSFTIILYYGGNVCPYIDGLGINIFAQELGLVFAAGLALRLLLGVYSAKAGWHDISTFAAMALSLALYNRAHYEFPFASGMKVAVGFLALGFFIGIHTYLAEQHAYLLTGKFRTERTHARSSIITKISLVTVLSVVLSTAIIFLVVNKDLKWLAEQPPGTLAYYRPSVLKEILFVMLVLLAFLISVIVAYARNLNLLFANQTRILEQVSAGNLGAHVPVLSDDEFGHIAEHTNAMIEGLREKEKIQSVFGKMVSPRIADRLLAGDAARLGGEKIEVTILMSDVRNFTTLSESLPPEELVIVMNRYFSVMVDIIHAHDGEVDKFIGDGILAIFGLDDKTRGPRNAVAAATAMASAARRLSLQIGLGIHSGEVIAGRIGSPDRQEYTFLGDAVNTAARLEAATKDLGRDIAVSARVFAELGDELKSAPWHNVGLLALKGKKNGIETFALSTG